MSQTDVKNQSWNILADSVSEVVGNQSLAYVSVKKAALNDEPSNERWASMMFNQISAANKRRIRTSAIDKAEEVKSETKQLLDDITSGKLEKEAKKPKVTKREGKMAKTQIQW